MADTFREGSPEWHFFRAYVAAALWSSTDDEGEPLNDGRDIDDVSPETLEQMEADCASFYAANLAHIQAEGTPLSREFEGSLASRKAAMAGNDFWLTRCGHGAGFWDGDWPEPHATALDEAATRAGNVDLYVGDDGMVHA